MKAASHSNVQNVESLFISQNAIRKLLKNMALSFRSSSCLRL